MKDYGLIEYQHLFSTYGEFKKKKAIIKKAYAKWNKQEIAIYRMFVFSRPILKEKQKEWIWQELNEYRDFVLYYRGQEDEGSD